MPLPPPAEAFDPAAALACWARREVPRPVDGGLINRTWTVGEPPSAVLQWVNPIFDPSIHLDLESVTRHLAGAGLTTPRLVPTPEGRLWIANAEGCWRLTTYVAGRTFHRLAGAAQAAAAGALVGRFHAALAGWRGELHAPPRRIHDTPARMVVLGDALAACDGHPLAAAARAVGAEVLAAWEGWEGELDLPAHLCHGDLKISNVRFDAAGRRALCLIDLDTLEPMPYASELGDAWRSWCNPAGEDHPEESRLDLELFAAAARAWLAAAPPLSERELASLVPGLERIVLELAARFTADAVRNSYFHEDRRRFPQPGAHNLLRARGQLQLARSARTQRAACAAIIREAAG